MSDKTEKVQHQVAELETIPGHLADLRAFCSVVDLGSVTAAAKTLNETKSSISRRLARLERSLGSALVRRSPRLVKATEAGQRFRERLGRVFELLEAATEELREVEATPRGRLRMTAPQDLASLLSPLIAEFGERFPQVQLELLLTDKQLDFDGHQIDFAFRAAASLRDSSLIAHKLLDIEMGFVSSPAYLARRGAIRKLEGLDGHRILLMRTGPGGTFPFTRRGQAKPTILRLEPSVVAQDGVFLRELTGVGGGVALLPLVLVERHLADKRLVRVLPEYRLDINVAFFLLYPAMEFVPPKVKAFRDFILERFSKRR